MAPPVGLVWFGVAGAMAAGVIVAIQNKDRIEEAIRGFWEYQRYLEEQRLEEQHKVHLRQKRSQEQGQDKGHEQAFEEKKEDNGWDDGDDLLGLEVATHDEARQGKEMTSGMNKKDADSFESAGQSSSVRTQNTSGLRNRRSENLLDLNFNTESNNSDQIPEMESDSGKTDNSSQGSWIELGTPLAKGDSGSHADSNLLVATQDVKSYSSDSDGSWSELDAADDLPAER